MMTLFTLTLIRHGETTYNKLKIIQGQLDTELSNKGLEQAKLCGLRLQNEHFTHVYASDLERAKKTCELILAENVVTSCKVNEDNRLRERHFGIFQGKTMPEIRRSMGKKSPDDYIPPGGESIDQVQERAISFFHDICQQMQTLAKEEAAQSSPATIKQHRLSHGSSSSGDVFQLSPDNAAPPMLHERKLLLEPTTDATTPGRHRSTGSTSSTSGYSSMGADSLEHLAVLSPADPAPVSSQPFTIAGASSSTTHPLTLAVSPQITSEDEETLSSPDDLCSYSPPSAYSFTPTIDADIRSTVRITPPIGGAQFACPNVSLSPIFEHRLTSISSISSGRNSSFDDSDIPPHVVGDVLVVSHGGLLKEMIMYFVEEFGCRLPGGLSAILTSPFNTAVTKFTICIQGDSDTPVMTCNMFNDKDHLENGGLDALLETDEI